MQYTEQDTEQYTVQYSAVQYIEKDTEQYTLQYTSNYTTCSTFAVLHCNTTPIVMRSTPPPHPAAGLAAVAAWVHCHMCSTPHPAAGPAAVAAWVHCHM